MSNNYIESLYKNLETQHKIIISWGGGINHMYMYNVYMYMSLYFLRDSLHQAKINCIREAAKKVFFFSGQSTKRGGG